MIVPVAIDSASLAKDPLWSDAHYRGVLLSLLDVCRRFGFLIHDGERLDSSRLFKAVQSLPQGVRPYWQEVLERYPVGSWPAWNGVVESRAMTALERVAQVAFVDDVTAEAEFGFDPEADEITLPANESSISIARIAYASHVGAFTQAGELADAHIEAGTRWETLWSTRFRSLAHTPVKDVSVVDRYVMEQHFNHSQSSLSGLERFLKLLDAETACKRTVSVYSSWTENLGAKIAGRQKKIEESIRDLEKRLPKKKIKLSVYMIEDKRFGLCSHDRFVRFGPYVWDLGIGLKVFDGPVCPQTSTASFKSGVAVKGYRDVESALSAGLSARF